MPSRSPRPDPRPAEPCVVQVTTRGGPFTGVDPRSIRLRAQKMIAALGITNAELSIALVDDPCIRELNRSFRDINRPTDVLAFPMAGGEGREEREPVVVDGLPNLLGDVVISVPTAGRQARRLRRRLLDELTTLLAHGLLHLLGLDHATRADERTMKQRTAELEEAARRPRRKVRSGPSRPGRTARGSRRR
ncbi:MAG: rRNA maturation RNase YbeY [Deltaproteobacteria bacterium]|nr:rRNA maturation RNase YbeY [Deltaproteobacteria bacterium]